MMLMMHLLCLVLMMILPILHNNLDPVPRMRMPEPTVNDRLVLWLVLLLVPLLVVPLQVALLLLLMLTPGWAAGAAERLHAGLPGLAGLAGLARLARLAGLVGTIPHFQ